MVTESQLLKIGFSLNQIKKIVFPLKYNYNLHSIGIFSLKQSIEIDGMLAMNSFTVYIKGIIDQLLVSSLEPRHNGRHFLDDIFKCIFMKEVIWISIEISLNFVPKGPINNIPALVQIMAWRQPGDKPWCEPILVSLLTLVCVIRPQWVKCAHLMSLLPLLCVNLLLSEMS